MHLFTREQRSFLEANVSGISNKKLTELFNSHFKLNLETKQIKNFKKNHKLSSGLTGHFPKGHAPFNKGKKGISYRGMEPTQFKEGHKPHNWVPIGSERITKDGYIQIKIQEGKFQHNWRGKHILIWEEHNGPVPKGHKIVFGDGDIRNFDIENLMLVSNYQMLYLNRHGLVKNDAEITKVGVVLADISKKISERK